MKLQKTAIIFFTITVMTLLGVVVMSQGPIEVIPAKQWAGSSVVKGDIYRLGNVGIGTTASGSFKLAVEGKLGAREIIVQNESNPNEITISLEYSTTLQPDALDNITFNLVVGE